MLKLKSQTEAFEKGTKLQDKSRDVLLEALASHGKTIRQDAKLARDDSMALLGMVLDKTQKLIPNRSNAGMQQQEHQQHQHPQQHPPPYCGQQHHQQYPPPHVGLQQQQQYPQPYFGLQYQQQCQQQYPSPYVGVQQQFNTPGGAAPVAQPAGSPPQGMWVCPAQKQDNGGPVPCGKVIPMGHMLNCFFCSGCGMKVRRCNSCRNPVTKGLEGEATPVHCIRCGDQLPPVAVDA
jgi:hypothetical protein